LHNVSCFIFLAVTQLPTEIPLSSSSVINYTNSRISDEELEPSARFAVNPRGYLGYFDPKTGEHETFAIKGDATALVRMELKLQTETARISRHQFLTSSRNKPCERIGKKRRK
jgi:hypothetical protein